MTSSQLPRDSRCGVSGRDPSEEYRPATTPKARASYNAVRTMPRLVGSPSPPTTIGATAQFRSAWHLDRCHELVEVDVQDQRTSAGRDLAAQHDPTG